MTESEMPYPLFLAMTGLIPIGVGRWARKVGRGPRYLAIADDDSAPDSRP